MTELIPIPVWTLVVFTTLPATLAALCVYYSTLLRYKRDELNHFLREFARGVVERDREDG